jgi:hypothetical protein
MADSILTNLASGATPAGADLFYSVQGGVSKKVTGTQIVSFVTGLSNSWTAAQLFADGTATAPSIARASETTNGFFFTLSAVTYTRPGANDLFTIGLNGNLTFRRDVLLQWVSSLASSTGTPDLTLGRLGAANLQLGVNSATPVNQVISGAGGSGTNIAGGHFSYTGGFGTGNAEPGLAQIQYYLKVASGTTAQALSVNLYPIPSCLFVATADGTLTASVATTGSLLGTGVGTKTIEAGLMRAGRIVRIKWKGVLTTTVAGPTLKIDIKLGSTVVATTGALAPPGNVSNTAVWGEVDLVCRTYGAAGTVQGDGSMFLDNATLATTHEGFYQAATTVDLTGALVADVFGTWSAGTALNSIKLSMASIEYIN